MNRDSSTSDRTWMERAVAEARRCSPVEKRDPLVGAVAVDKNGKLVDTAFRSERRAGEHAEYTLLEAKLKDSTLAGATIFTTLEPCTSRNSDKKIPCAKRLIDRQVARVVVGILDPNRDISGDGVRMLQAANIKVEYFDEDLRQEIEELNREFRRHFELLQNRTVRAPEADALLDERTALRSYLQRGEVRLSTMHRIAGSFLSGAGLLVLLPVLFRDSLNTIITIISSTAAAQTTWITAACCGVPCLIVFGIPLWSLWLLLEDLTLFYFTANIPPGKQPPIPAGSRPLFNNAFHPRFALTGIPFSDDEAPAQKRRMRQHQFNTPLMYFALSAHEDENVWLVDQEKSQSGAKVALPKDDWLDECYDDDNARALRMAFGLAGAYNRDLVEEAAKLELSLVRHNLLLRRLVMRYMKALLIIVWTAIVAFVVSASIPRIREDLHVAAVLGALWVWSVFVQALVPSPVRWIRREYVRGNSDFARDPHLRRFETIVVSLGILLSLFSSITLYRLVDAWLWTTIAASILVASLSTYYTIGRRWRS